MQRQFLILRLLEVITKLRLCLDISNYKYYTIFLHVRQAKHIMFLRFGHLGEGILGIVCHGHY